MAATIPVNKEELLDVRYSRSSICDQSANKLSAQNGFLFQDYEGWKICLENCAYADLFTEY